MKSKKRYYDSLKLLSFLVLFTCLFWSFSSKARESFTFELGKSVHVLSDKAFRKSKENLFEAVGNVIITQNDDALYGEKASLSMLSGDAFVEGNARYIGNNLTAYGTKISYNFKSDFLDIENARVISDNFVVLGKRISRTSKNTMIAENAEYTTCKDCPESWSILGKKVHITTGEYIRITHAYIKVSGVVVMYVPYIVLPIKKNRETGLLFPSFALDFDEGVNFSQPWFYAISKSSDLTFTPIFFGKRGSGAHTEYRHVFGEKKWLDLNSLNSLDRVYRKNLKDLDEENKGVVLSGRTEYRTFNDLETFWLWNNSFGHYLNVSWPDDLDMIRDYDEYLTHTNIGSEKGIDAFLNYRASFFDINIESYFNRNLLYEDSSGFDHRYVQILPRLSYSVIPINFFQTDTLFLRSLNLFANGDYTIFKQNHLLEGDMIRNAHRINNNLTLEWKLGRLGPMSLQTSAKLDHQNYRFPYEKKEKSFYKYGLIYESEAKLELSKIYGVAYRKKVKRSDILLDDEDETKDLDKKKKTRNSLFAFGLEKDKEEVEDNIIGKLPSIDDFYNEDEDVEVINSSYRHLQTFKVRHLYLTNQKTSGSQKFYNQISNFDGDGQFDAKDALIEKENELSETSSKVQLPVNNTIEFVWNNSLIKKSAKNFNVFTDGKSIRDNFDFSRISFFNVSQGLDLYTLESEFEDKLTRLLIETGVSNKLFNLSLSEYYFYDKNKHILNFNLGQNFSYFTYNLKFIYDSFSLNRDVVFDIKLDVLPRISLKMNYDYDIQSDQLNSSRYSVLYSPSNKCWKMDIHYSTDKIKKKFSFNFYVNFNDNNFTGLSGIQ